MGDCKIPSILWYDRQGTIRAIGAEARISHVEGQAVEEGWVLSKWSILLS